MGEGSGFAGSCGEVEAGGLTAVAVEEAGAAVVVGIAVGASGGADGGCEATGRGVATEDAAG